MDAGKETHGLVEENSPGPPAPAAEEATGLGVPSTEMGDGDAKNMEETIVGANGGGGEEKAVGRGGGGGSDDEESALCDNDRRGEGGIGLQ